MNTQEFNTLQKKALSELERYPILAYYNGEDAYCLYCMEEYVLEKDEDKIAQLYLDILADKVVDNEYVFDIITTTTKDFEQEMGEIIPLEGVYCCRCGSELYAPMEDENE